MDIVTYALCKKQITQAIEGVTEWERRIVSELPVTGEEGVIYLVLDDNVENVYNEFVWVDNDYARIGTRLDVTNTTTDIDYILGV